MAFVKMVAGILKVDFADLWEREKRERRKRQIIAGVIASVFIALLMYASTQRFSESVNKELESVNTKIASIHYSIRHDNLPVETVIALNIELKELEKLKEAKEETQKSLGNLKTPLGQKAKEVYNEKGAQAAIAVLTSREALSRKEQLKKELSLEEISLAKLYVETNDFIKAEQRYEEALVIFFDFENAKTYIDFLKHQKHYDKAIELSHKLLKEKLSQDQEASCLNMLGLLYEATNRYSEAEEFYLGALRINRILEKEKISEFQLKIENTYQQESREIFSLKNEINKLLINNTDMARETENLTRALKGNAKAQGIWGEIILEKILESSGLREGEEYITQGRNLKLKSEDNRSLKPDVIINLPDNKHLIIDAKVSLTNYEQYIEAVNNDSPKEIIQEKVNLFIKSIQSHINNLSGKNYQYSEGLLTPDFVILFLPIEGAFSLALQIMPELLMQAWHSKIIIVSPTTLFATLKTIASIWLFEKQNKNAILIAKESGLLYDKFVLFTEDLTKIGLALNKADEAYNAAVNKLSTGKGNILSKTEKIRILGAKASKKLDQKLQEGVNQDDSCITDSSCDTDNNIVDETELELN
jgi:DNA recombination protein RmuC